MFCPLNLLQIDSNGVASCIVVGHVTDTMRCQIGVPVLIIRNFEFAFVQADVVLYEEKEH